VKILLDECVTKKLKIYLPDFEVYTVTEMGWSGLKNGNLMRVAIDAQFDVLLTIDKNLEHQQNMNKYSIIVAVFDVEKSKIDFLKLLVPQFKARINEFKSGSVYRII
jgi:hypothetical protein